MDAKWNVAVKVLLKLIVLIEEGQIVASVIFIARHSEYFLIFETFPSFEIVETFFFFFENSKIYAIFDRQNLILLWSESKCLENDDSAYMQLISWHSVRSAFFSCCQCKSNISTWSNCESECLLSSFVKISLENLFPLKEYFKVLHVRRIEEKCFSFLSKSTWEIPKKAYQKLPFKNLKYFLYLL